MNITVIDKSTHEVIASLNTDKDDCGFCNNQYEVIVAENEPVFENRGGTIYLKQNSFIVDLGEGEEE